MHLDVKVKMQPFSKTPKGSLFLPVSASYDLAAWIHLQAFCGPGGSRQAFGECAFWF